MVRNDTDVVLYLSDIPEVPEVPDVPEEPDEPELPDVPEVTADPLTVNVPGTLRLSA